MVEKDVALRSALGAVLGRRESHDGEKFVTVPAVRFQLQTFHMLGVRIDNITGMYARRVIQHFIEHYNGLRAGKVFFTNVHSICTAQFNWLVKQCINSADLVLPDGMGIKIGGAMTGNPIHENLNGTDFTPAILRMAQEKGWSVYFFGAAKEVVEQCCKNVRAAFPRLHIVGVRNGFFTPEEEEEIVVQINAVHPDILLVALGTPMQEVWLTRYSSKLNAKVCMAVGGLFDFLSYSRKRAPQWMRSMGLEWLYRFLIDPKEKWKRVFIEIPMFFSLFIAKYFFPKNIIRTVKRVFSL